MRFLVLVFLLCWPLGLFAQKETLLAGISVFEPWVIEKEGVFSGISYDFLKEAVTRAGIETKFEAWPLARYFNYAENGKFDIAVGSVTTTPFFTKHYKSIPGAYIVNVMLVSHAKSINPSTQKLTIGKARGVECPVFSKEQTKNIQFIDCDSVDQGLSLLAGKRVDALCTDLQTFYFHIKNSKHANLKTYPQRKYASQTHNSVFLKKDLVPIYEERIKKALKDMEKDGTILKIYKKYGMDY